MNWIVQILKKLPKRRACNAHALQSKSQCTKRALWGTKYCWQHESKLYLVIFPLIGITSLVWKNQKLGVLQKATDDMKVQLAQANESLANSTAVVKGLAIGGDSRAEIMFGQTDDTNTLSATMTQKGDYPLRGLSIKITDETKRINARWSGGTNAPPEGPVVFQRFFGDVAVKSYGDLCTLRFDPAVTNYYRFDVSALNGSFWQIISFSKTNTNWVMKLIYKWGRFGDKVEMDPPEMRGRMLVY